jgi:5-methylcytosine-specific restriction endonuclease McrA
MTSKIPSQNIKRRHSKKSLGKYKYKYLKNPSKNHRNYNDPEYVAARRKAKLRDEYKCQFPQCTNRKKLHCHHIVKWCDNESRRYDVDNLITLCYTHHKLVTGNEDAYIPLFLHILQIKKKKK